MLASLPSRPYSKLVLAAFIACLLYTLQIRFGSFSRPQDEPQAHKAIYPIAGTTTPASSNGFSQSPDSQAPQPPPVPAGSTMLSDEFDREHLIEELAQAGQSGQDAQASPEVGSAWGTIDDEAIDQVLVIGKTESEDTTWLEELPDWQHAVYEVDNQSAALHTPANKGKEAMIYLTYLIDHYHKLPKSIVFLHPHAGGYPGGWHTDAPDHSNIWSVNHLNLDFVQRNGYANLRCIYIPGCPDEIQPFRNDEYVDRSSERAFAQAWKELFLNDQVPEQVGVACCAQFAVSRDQVMKRPLSDYLRYRQWLLDTEMEDELSGRIFEYLWHIIFGQHYVYCPELGQCYRDVYNGDQVPPSDFENPPWVGTTNHT